MSASLAATISIMLNALAAMVKIFLVSAVGIFLAKYPKGDPILPPLMIKYLSKLTNNVFVPALIINSLGSAITFPLLSRIGILVCFCFVTNTISYCFGYSFGRLLHGRSDDPMFIALTVAIGSPNAISLPIMVMQTMCEESYVKKDYDDNKNKCFAEATSMLFVYSMGWHLMFWSYGFPKLKSIKKRFYSELCIVNDEVANFNNSVTPNNTDSKIECFLKNINFYANKTLLINWLKTIFLTPAMIAIFVGVAIGLIPFTQELMFQKMSFLRPLGSAITTLGEPVVAVNCLIMSASLAQVDFSKKTKISETNETESNPTNIETNVRLTDDVNDTSDCKKNEESLLSKFLIGKLPSLKLVREEAKSSKYSRLTREEDIESMKLFSDNKEECEGSVRSSFVIENDDDDNDVNEDLNHSDNRKFQNDEKKESFELLSSNFDDDTQHSPGSSQSQLQLQSAMTVVNINSDDIIITCDNEDMINDKLISPGTIRSHNANDIIVRAAIIPPPTYGSIIALIVCR